MNIIVSFLSNPIVGLIGYVFSFIAALIAMNQFLEKSKAQKEVRDLKIEIKNFKSNTLNKNKIKQGDKSQYFQENSGPVVIDNRD
ncbi:hypothetical protein [Crenothrix sp.]|uniref:hypothetical protein n=1 Tax=Crenothrix sp. TaxID=3100433 RepID=UPI00374CC575